MLDKSSVHFKLDFVIVVANANDRSLIFFFARMLGSRAWVAISRRAANSLCSQLSTVGFATYCAAVVLFPALSSNGDGWWTCDIDWMGSQHLVDANKEDVEYLQNNPMAYYNVFVHQLRLACGKQCIVFGFSIAPITSSTSSFALGVFD